MGLLLLVATTAGCATPLSTLDPASSSTAAIATLWWVMLGGAAAILIGVTAAFLYSFKKHRRREVPEGYFLWGGGLAFPAVVLTALMAVALPVGQALLLPDEDDVVRVEAIGNQWWWAFVHTDAPQGPVHAAVDLHIPAGRLVEVTLTSDNVIHSFWVPRVTWKLDVVPGHSNRLRLRADEPGVYEGVCAEFCGLHHAHMPFRLIAHAGDGYEAYLADAAAAAVDADHPGATDFVAECSGCHSVDPLEPSPAPHLHRLRDRRLLGGVLAYEETADLRHWLREHENLKPGTFKPIHDHIPDDQLERIIGYLESAP